MTYMMIYMIFLHYSQYYVFYCVCCLLFVIVIFNSLWYLLDLMMRLWPWLVVLIACCIIYLPCVRSYAFSRHHYLFTLTNHNYYS